MRAVLHTDLDAFWAKAEPVFRADPIRHTVALTVFHGLRTAPDPTAEPPLLVTFDDNGHTAGAAFCTPPWPVAVSGAPEHCIPALVDLLREIDYPVTGVNGPVESADFFHKAWLAAGATEAMGFQLRTYRLAELVLPTVPGTVRAATEDDVPFLAHWREEFGGDTGHMPHQDHAEFIRRSMALGNANLLWEVDGIPVSYAAATKPVEAMSRVGPVYTPREHRGHGYGSAATAAVSRWALDAGAEHVILFADQANPTSNSIYQRIGYVPHHDAADYRFAR
jgi:predicted GNAT family acetyltransferase